MAHDQKFIDLERFLDGEMSAREADNFTAGLAADAELKVEYEARCAERRIYLEALGEGISAGEPESAASDAQAPQVRPYRSRPFPLLRVGVALAASLCLVLLTPRILRNDDGAEGPRSQITMSGQVVVVRFGEVPGGTTVLEAGGIELPAGLSR